MSRITAQPRTVAYRRDMLWFGAWVHRVSGILLACFLPLHFLVLGLALESEARLGQALSFGAQPLVKLAEAVLVALLTIHLAGGVRILVVESWAWMPGQRRLVVASLGAALALGVIYLVRVL